MSKTMTTAYINNVIFSSYLNKSEQDLLQSLDFQRWLAYEYKSRYKHFNNTLHMELYNLEMNLRDQIYGRYIEEYQSDPEKLLQDIQATMDGVTPSIFFKETFVYAMKRPFDKTTKETIKELDVDINDIKSIETFTENTLIYLCKAMIQALDKGGHTEGLDTAAKIIRKRAKECARYAKNRFDINNTEYE